MRKTTITMSAHIGVLKWIVLIEYVFNKTLERISVSEQFWNVQNVESAIYSVCLRASNLCVSVCVRDL